MSNDNNSDRRRHSRYPIKAKVWVISSEDVHVMHIHDLSINGTLVDTTLSEGSPDIAIGVEVGLLLFRTEGFDSLELKGRVVRFVPSDSPTVRFGMDFSLSTDEARERLERLLIERHESYPDLDHLKVKE